MQGTAPKRPEPPIDAARAKAKARACYLQSGRIEGEKKLATQARPRGQSAPTSGFSDSHPARAGVTRRLFSSREDRAKVSHRPKMTM